MPQRRFVALGNDVGWRSRSLVVAPNAGLPSFAHRSCETGWPILVDDVIAPDAMFEADKVIAPDLRLLGIEQGSSLEGYRRYS